MSRPSLLRDAALGYASRGIPLLPLHYPLPHRGDLQALTGGGRPVALSAAWTSCSCRDPSCSQVAKHPLGALVPHGVKDATTNRARVLAWWTQQPQANIGLATGHRFDVLDIDGPTGTQAIRAFASEHVLHSSGPLVRTGGGGWHFYLAPTGSGNRAGVLEQVDWRGRGGYVVAPPSRHRSGHPYQWVAGRDLDTPLPEVPPPLLERLHRQLNRRATPSMPLPVGDRPGPRYGQAALTQELARVAAAPHGQRNQQLWEAARNLYNLVAAGALDDHQVHHGLVQAAERCGLLGDEPRQTHRTLASGRQVGLTHPRPVPGRTRPEPTHAWPPLPARPGGERTQEGR